MEIKGHGKVGRALAVSLLLCLGIACRTPAPREFPIGLYSVPKEDLAKVKQAGFNTVAGPAQGPYLDAARAAGVKVFASPGSTAEKFDRAAAKSVVGKFDSHPSLWAWELVDEPDLSGTSPQKVVATRNALKSFGAKKPTAFTLFHGESTLDYGGIPDILMIDRYPVPWAPLCVFNQHVKWARLGRGPAKPLVAILQAFDWQYYPQLRPPADRYRPPTFEELRCMAYCAMAQQVEGLFFYAFKEPAWKIEEHPEVWASLTNTVREVNERLPLFQAKHLWWPHLVTHPELADYFNETHEWSIELALLQVTAENDFVLPGRYLLAVNTTPRQLRAELTLPLAQTQPVFVFGENRTVPVADHKIGETFDPFAVHIYGPLSEAPSGAARPPKKPAGAKKGN